MSLIDGILNDVISDNVNIPNILRKCLVLGFELNHQVLIEWVESELSGYNSSLDLPPYRILPCRILGDFQGYNFQLNSMPIDLWCLDDVIRDKFSKIRLIQSISEVESLSKDRDNSELGYPIGPSYLPLIDSPYGDSQCYKAWIYISRSALVSIIDEVKNRILRTLLQINKEIPEAKDIKMDKLDQKQKEAIKQIINNNFTNNISGNANIANASESFSQTLQVQSHDLIDKLLSELLEIKKQGKDTQIIDDIIPHVESMKSVKDQTGVMTKLVEIMTIAGGSASVLSVITPYISQLKELFM
ncbi:hypothetical protein C3Z14_06425 [Proteus mirabilis]|uniref:AbiTii domain-containing protein n=1 Tax=Proteus mirabilis TaxID=584 RepID=UPI000CE05372|nr:hypothetical protein [Proteus mirabilis]AVA39664.1 hypothetical protein C3Z14_06425 [Proteus mirabilis]MDF7173717.1 hypothetical protein [Proteus mirabilis]MDF7454104.1 hypothetical protein [Proteus mirabilis]MDF7479982.1 hypothetical protein [Proteus mirabilis]HCR4072926.1 hypothetical protein [Proteus mirabilis]